MARNKLIDLHNILFEQIERLNDDDLMEDPEALDREIKRSKAITQVSTKIISVSSLSLKARKHYDEYGINKDGQSRILIDYGENE